MTPADLRHLRESIGLSQAGLAEALGMTQASVSQMESGKRPILRRTILALERVAASERATSEGE